MGISQGAQITNLEEITILGHLAISGGYEEVFQVTSHHGSHHAIVIDLTTFKYSGIPTVAQHYSAVRDLLHLMKPVGDIDDANAVCSQVLNNVQQSACFGKAQARRWFIHYQDASTSGNCARNLH